MHQVSVYCTPVDAQLEISSATHFLATKSLQRLRSQSPQSRTCPALNMQMQKQPVQVLVPVAQWFRVSSNVHRQLNNYLTRFLPHSELLIRQCTHRLALGRQSGKVPTSRSHVAQIDIYAGIGAAAILNSQLNVFC
jgi:hypothetical protein